MQRDISIERSAESLGPGAEPEVTFVVKMAAALHAYGVPSHRLEMAVDAMFARFGLRGSVFSMPTGLLVSVGAPEEQRTSLVRIEPGDANLEKLVQLDELTDDVMAGDVAASDGLRRIDKIVSSPPRYRDWLVVMAFGASSATACMFLGGRYREVITSLLIGLVIGVLWAIAKRWRDASFLFEPIAASLAAAIAIAAANLWSPLSVPPTTVAGLIALLPGLTLTTAMTELATRNLVAGTVRLVWAVVVFLEIAFGVALGNGAETLFPHPAGPSVVRMVTPFTGWLAAFVAPIAFAVRFYARPKDFGWIIGGGIVSLAGARFGASVVGPELGAFIGAFFVRAFSAVYSRVTRRPIVVVQIPSLMLLVPGSIGFGSVLSFLDKNAVSGVEAAFQMTLVAVSLVLGLLFANAIFPSRKAL